MAVAGFAMPFAQKSTTITSDVAGLVAGTRRAPSRANAQASAVRVASAIARFPVSIAEACVSASNLWRVRLLLRSTMANGARNSEGDVSDTLHTAWARTKPPRRFAALGNSVKKG